MIKAILVVFVSLVLAGCVAIPITVGDTAGGNIHIEILKSNEVLAPDTP